MSFNKKLVSAIILASLVFFVVIGFNVSPFLRGPGPWPPDWRWPYQFVNTLNRVWAPLMIISFILYIGYFFDKKKKLASLDLWVLLVLLVILSYFFQLSVLYFSRSGISVLIHRVINPGLNGYFTEAVKIKNLGSFFSNYQKNVLNFSMHAAGHPPGPIIFYWLMEKLVNFIPLINNFVSNLIPQHNDVQIIWKGLTLNQKSAAVFSAFFVPFLASLNIIPLFLISRKLSGIKAAVRIALMSIFIPALTLFTPLPDVYFPIFFLSGFLIFIEGEEKNSRLLLAISGLVFSLGIFFSLSILPLLILFSYYFLKNRKTIIPFFMGGGLFYLAVYLFFGYNIFSVSYTLMIGLPKNRAYLPWVFYNLYDFFVFTGLPITLTYLTMFFKRIKNHLFIFFSLLLIFLNFSGAVRGEVGRIWLPLMFPLILITGSFLTNKLKLATKVFLVILFIQAVQVLVLQEFWVTLW